MEINKNEISIKQIKLYYEIPEDVEIEDTITFKATVQNELKEAIKEERYEDAAKIRDEIKKLS